MKTSKKSHSAFSSPVWKLFKKLFPNKQEKDYYMFSERCLKLASKDYKKHDLDVLFTEICALFHWKFRKMQHFFLDDGVADFCAGSVKEFSEDYCKLLPIINIDSEQNPFDLSFKAFAIHFPKHEKRNSIVILPDFCIPAERNSSGEISAVKRYFFSAFDGVDILLMNKRIKGSLGDCEWIAKLIFGFSLYIDAFPETVVKSKVGEIDNIRHYTGTHNTIIKNRIVVNECRNMTSPHFRRGHWRVLSSPKFVNKKGQTVYIEGCFVKGKAFDVLSDSPKN
jgi:hypothetical protein